jgi:hypothetical protein
MIYIRTRSTKEDYEFIGEKPTDSWWRTEYGSFLQEGTFNIVVEITSSTWRIFVGGIPAKRNDWGGRHLRYDFAGEGRCNDAGAMFFYRLFTYVLYADKNFEAISAALDRDDLFSKKYIDSIDHDRHSEKTCQEVKRKLEKLNSFLEREIISQGLQKKVSPEKNGVYQKNDSTCALFISAVSALIDPTKGPASLIITSLPIDKESANQRIQKFGGRFSNGKLLWLTEYDQGDADYDTGLIFPLEFPSPNNDQVNNTPSSSSGGNIMKTTFSRFIGGIIGELLISLILVIFMNQSKIKPLENRLDRYEQELSGLRKELVEIRNLPVNMEASNNQTQPEENGEEQPQEESQEPPSGNTDN